MISFLLSFIIQYGLAAEADHFSSQGIVLEDAKPYINQNANTYLEASIREFNQTEICENNTKSEIKVYKILRKYFANHSKGQLVKDVLYGSEIPKHVINLKESVYQNWSIKDGFLLGRKKASQSPLALAPLVRLNEQTVSTDKLEHLFGMGFKYFKNYYLKKKSLVRVLKKGNFLEKTALGGNVLATGVFSYADLSANFNGMRFWNHFFNYRDDILGSEYNLGPYLKCENGHLKKVKDIDLSLYFDESMDESINCSKFATKSGLAKFNESLKKLNIDACQSPNKKLFNLLPKYDIPLNSHTLLSDWIFNLEGAQTVSYLNEFKN